MDRVCYIRVPDGNTRSFLGEATIPSRGRPVASIHYRFTGDKIIFVWTICHQEDNFSYAEARRIAQDKIRNGKSIVTTVNDDDSVCETLKALPHTVRRAFADIVTDQRIYQLRQRFETAALAIGTTVAGLVVEANTFAARVKTGGGIAS